MLKTFLFIFILLSGAAARAVTLGLEDAGAYAVRHHPALAAARLRLEEARGRLHQVGRLQNPELEGTYRQNIRTPEREGEIALTQRFPLTARLRLEKQVSRAELARAEFEVRDAERKAHAQVSAAMVKLLALEAQQGLRETQRGLSREIATFTRKRFEIAEASANDIAQVELEAQQIEAESLLLEAEHSALLQEIRQLLGLRPSEKLTVGGSLPEPGVTPRGSLNVSARPDLQAARAGAEGARSAVDLERSRKWADLGVGLSASSELAEDAPEGLRRDEFLGLRLSLPLPLWNDNSGKVHEAQASAARQEKEIDALELTIRGEAEAARARMLALAKALTMLDETLLPIAAKVEEQLRAAQATAQAPLTDVLRARERRFQFQRQRLEALREYHLARVQFESATARHVSTLSKRP